MKGSAARSPMSAGRMASSIRSRRAPWSASSRTASSRSATVRNATLRGRRKRASRRSRSKPASALAATTKNSAAPPHRRQASCSTACEGAKRRRASGVDECLARRPAAKRRAGGGLRRRARVECDAPQLLRSHDCASSASSARDRAEGADARAPQRSANPCGPQNCGELRARRAAARPASILAASPTRATMSVAARPERVASRQSVAPFAPRSAATCDSCAAAIDLAQRA
jgi:hypothetical protein